jgi:hypothetical protein
MQKYHKQKPTACEIKPSATPSCSSRLAVQCSVKQFPVSMFFPTAGQERRSSKFKKKRGKALEPFIDTEDTISVINMPPCPHQTRRRCVP